MLVQEFNVKIDKGFIMSLYDVFAHLLTTEESEVIRDVGLGLFVCIS